MPGENLVGVFSANEYLTRVNLGRAYDFPNHDTPAFLGKNVTVFGAGNVAMDAARTALRMGAENVHIVYRRTRAEMPARHEEVEHAEEEGVKFAMLSAPVRFNGDDVMRLTSVTLQKMELGEPDASGRRRPVPVPGSEYDLPTDLAIVALGTRSNPILLEATEGLDKTERGYIKVNEETGETSLPNVFAGRRHRHRAATVILAMGAGRKAGREIVRRLGGIVTGKRPSWETGGARHWPERLPLPLFFPARHRLRRSPARGKAPSPSPGIDRNHKDRP